MTHRRCVKRSRGCTAFVPVLLLVNGCSSTVPSALSDSKALLLAGTHWTATVIENDFTAGRRPTIQFREDGKVVGTTGCTVYVASAERAGGTMRIRDLDLEPADARPGTCDSLHWDQQARFLRALASTRVVRMQSGKTLLLDAQRNLLALLERREDPGASGGRMVSEVGELAAGFPGAGQDGAAALGSYLANDPVKGMELVAVTPALGEYFGADAGVLVTRVPADNPFELREGDVILSVNGRQLVNGSHALRVLRSYPAGTALDLRVRRQREGLNLRVVLSE